MHSVRPLSQAVSSTAISICSCSCPAGEPEAGTVLIVGPAALLHPRVPQPPGSLVYELLTGHPEREPGELVFLADLSCELCAWPQDTLAKVSVEPPASHPGGRRLLAGR
jgi:hypothetical protein